MGYDVVGWRECSLQVKIDPQEFIQRRKLLSYKQLIEAQYPASQRDSIKISLAINGQVRPLKYADLSADLKEFEQGIPDCKSCPLAQEGEPVSCYRYISYPIDAAFEELVFAYYYETLENVGSPAQILTDESIATEIEREDSPFHERGEGALAARKEPLLARFQDGQIVIDSAHLLCCLFGLAEEPPSIDTQSEFADGFFEWIETIREKSPNSEVEKIAQAALSTAGGSGTLEEYRRLAALLRPIVEHDWEMHGNA